MQFIHQAPEQGGFTCSRSAGNQDVGLAHTGFLQFVIVSALSAVKMLKLFRVVGRPLRNNKFVTRNP